MSTATLEPYVNDRPYVASSMLSVAIGKLFGTALAGTCEAQPELVDQLLDLEITVPVVGAPHGGDLIRKLFEPLGWDVEARLLPLDETFESWGPSRLASLTLRGSMRVADALAHLYVLLPALDGKKHYWIGEEEIDKLMRRGGEWLAAHPEKELISRRYLRFSSLTREAMTRLDDGSVMTEQRDQRNDAGEHGLEQSISLNDQRLASVISAISAAGGGRVGDLGCGEGRLLERLATESTVDSLLGVDVSLQALDRAEARLRLEDMSERRREKITLIQGALTYADERLRGLDIATLIEVIEHVDAERLDVLARVVFGEACPTSVIVTTPNIEYNVHFEQLPEGEFRHGDHRFEWTREEFTAWAEDICSAYGYSVEFTPIGPVDDVTGPPTQMAVFTKRAR